MQSWQLALQVPLRFSLFATHARLIFYLAYGIAPV